MDYYRVVKDNQQVRVYPFEHNDPSDRQRACDLADKLAEGLFFGTDCQHVQVYRRILGTETLVNEFEN